MMTSIDNPKERLLRTATRLFYAHGIARVGINEVIREAGIARMTLYNHFASKEELVRAVLKMQLADWQTSLNEGLATRPDDPKNQLLGVFDLLEERFLTPQFRGCIALNFTQENSGQDEKLTEISQAHKFAVFKLLEKMVKALPVQEHEELARGLLLIHNGATVLAQMGGKAYQSGDARRAAASLIRTYENPTPLKPESP